MAAVIPNVLLSVRSKHAPSFDTLKLMRHFEHSGFTTVQSEALVDSLRDVMSDMYVQAECW